METTPTGTAPLTTAGDTGNPVALTPEQVQARLEQAERERDEAKASLLHANRVIESGKKFEKYEEFRDTVTSKLETLEQANADKDKTIEDLKQILATKSAITPNINTQPSTPPPTSQSTEEEAKIRHLFGLPITK